MNRKLYSLTGKLVIYNKIKIYDFVINFLGLKYDNYKFYNKNKSDHIFIENKNRKNI